MEYSDWCVWKPIFEAIGRWNRKLGFLLPEYVEAIFPNYPIEYRRQMEEEREGGTDKYIDRMQEEERGREGQTNIQTECKGKRERWRNKQIYRQNAGGRGREGQKYRQIYKRAHKDTCPPPYIHT